MEPVNIHQAKTHLSQLLQEVEQGEEVGEMGFCLVDVYGFHPRAL